MKYDDTWWASKFFSEEGEGLWCAGLQLFRIPQLIVNHGNFLQSLLGLVTISAAIGNGSLAFRTTLYRWRGQWEEMIRYYFLCWANKATFLKFGVHFTYQNAHNVRRIQSRNSNTVCTNDVITVGKQDKTVIKLWSWLKGKQLHA